MKEKIKINTMGMMCYDEEKGEEYYIAICEDCGKYGIVDNTNKILVPFEYDNISRVWVNIFQLSKDGKVGLANFGENENKFIIERIIACEYDYLKLYESQEVVLLNKCNTYGEKTSIYFVKSQKFLRDVDHCSILRCSTNLIEFTKYKASHLYDCRTGDIVYKTDMVCVDGYSTLYNRIVQYITKDGRTCLLRENDKGVKEFIFDSNYIIPINEAEVDDCITTMGFLIEKENGYAVLNEDCDVLADVKTGEIAIRNVVEFEIDGKRDQIEVSYTRI